MKALKFKNSNSHDSDNDLSNFGATPNFGAWQYQPHPEFPQPQPPHSEFPQHQWLHHEFLHHQPPQQHRIEYRSIDGSGNNLANLNLGAAGTDFTRIGPAHFLNDDGRTPIEGPNARMISNVVVGEGDADVPNAEGLSGFMYAWGQFVDHDLDLSRSDGITHFDILNPGEATVFQSVTRAIIDPTSGTPEHPGTAINSVTHWIDASMVYGSDATTAASLRLADGHMNASAGGNLPIVNGQFLAGDVRAQENPSLTALQTLFLREHNYQVDQLHQAHQSWSAEQLYQQARAIVTAEIEHITYSDFLPHLLGPDALSHYHGYDPTVDPGITEEFAGAAFRWGHSTVSADTDRIDNFGATTGPELELKETFFLDTSDFAAFGGSDGFLRHLASDPAQAMDARIVDDLRNFLNDPPAAQDLAAINIQRGRDLGLGTLNQTREALGLDPYTSIDHITDDAGTVQALKLAFGDDVNKIDLWTGGLSEKHVSGGMLGETFRDILTLQFENLRDGDRLWFENQGFDAKTLNEIEHTTLADIILRNTDTKAIQDDVFAFYSRHSGATAGVPAEDQDARQLVIGSNGTDTLFGGTQDDILVASNGHQTMTGGDAIDTFVFDVTVKIDAVITDFEQGETLEFDNAGKWNFHDLRIRFDHGNTVVNFGDDHITLVGINPHQLNVHDFTFHI